MLQINTISQHLESYVLMSGLSIEENYVGFAVFTMVTTGCLRDVTPYGSCKN
jgi:hypothetical protein